MMLQHNEILATFAKMVHEVHCIFAKDELSKYIFRD